MSESHFYNHIVNLFRKDCFFSIKNGNQQEMIFFFYFKETDSESEPKYLEHFHTRQLFSEEEIFSYLLKQLSLDTLVSVINNSENIFEKTMSSAILIYTDQYNWETIKELVFWYVKYIKEYLFQKALYPKEIDYIIYSELNYSYGQYCGIISFFMMIKNPRVLKKLLSFIKTSIVDQLNEESQFSKQELYVYQDFQEFLSYCSQILSYPDFYEAWHSNLLTESLSTPYYITIKNQRLNSITEQKDLFKRFKNRLIDAIPNDIKPRIKEKIQESQDVADLEEVFIDLKELLQTENIALFLGNDKPSQLLQEFCDQLSDFVQIDWNR